MGGLFLKSNYAVFSYSQAGSPAVGLAKASGSAVATYRPTAVAIAATSVQIVSVSSGTAAPVEFTLAANLTDSATATT